MRRILLLLVLGLPSPGAAQTSAIDLETARSYFAELKRLGEMDRGRLWGRPVAGAMMFADARSRTVVANMPDTLGLLREVGGVWVGSLTPEQNVANTAIHWAGRDWSMVMWPVSDSRYVRQRLLMHESYHRIQKDLGLPATDGTNAHLADVEARIWTRLEWRALTEALLRSGEERAVALTDALTFRAKRHSLFATAAEDERLLELNEGLAEYTGLALSGLPRSALPDRAAVQLAQYEQQENFARSFAYASGPAYALLLDMTGRSWREGLNGKSDLSLLAAEAYSVKPAVMEATARAERYNPHRMINEERARDAARKAAVARVRAKLVDGPVLRLPVVGKFNYSFDPNGATPIDGAGTAFESSRVSDEWGVLEVSSGGVLMLRTNGSVTGVAVPLPPGSTPPMKGDGWTLQLAPGWSIRKGERTGDWVVARQ